MEENFIIISPPEGLEIKTLADVEKIEEFEMFKDIITLIEKLYNLDINDETKKVDVINDCIDYLTGNQDELLHIFAILIQYVLVRPLHRKFFVQLMTKIFNTFPEAASLADQRGPPYSPFTHILIRENLIPGEKLGTYGDIESKLVYTIYDTKTVLYQTFIDDPTSEVYKTYATKNIALTDYDNSPTAWVCYKNTTSFIELAAFWGSMKCLQFIFQNNCTITDDVPKYAIAGGNEEVIEMLKNKDISFDSCLNVSVRSHRYKLTEWLWNDFKDDPKLENTILFQNYRAFFFFLFNGVEIVKEPCTPSVIEIACEYSSLKMFKYILSWNFYGPAEPGGSDDLTPLQIAAGAGQLSIVKYLIEELNCPVYSLPDVTLYECACGSKSNVDVLKYLYEERHIKVEKSNLDITPLMVASGAGKLEIVKYLVEKCHMDPNDKNPAGLNCLHLACKDGALSIVKYFLENNLCNKEEESDEGQPPITIAVSFNNFLVLEYLHKVQHCNPLIPDSEGPIPPIYAANFNCTACLQYYIANNLVPIDYICKSANGFTLLHFALRNPENTSCINFLIQKGANLNIQDDDGNTPLHIAVSSSTNDNILPIQLLVEAGANLEIQNNDLYTPLQFAFTKNKSKAFGFLIGVGANLNAKFQDGSTILSIECRQGELDVVKLLCECDGIDVDSGPNGCSPLILACDRGDVLMVQYLCEHTNCNKYHKTPDGTTALFQAVRRGHFPILFYLLQIQHMDKNEINSKGQTLLHVAAIFKSLEIVQYLVEQEHFDINLLDKIGVTPLAYAACVGSKEIVEYLVQNGAKANVKGQKENPFDNICTIPLADKSLIPEIKALLEKAK